MEEIMIGKYAIAPLMTTFLALFYKLVPIEFSPRWKSLVAVLCGVVLSLIAIPYNGLLWTLPTVVDFSIYGVLLGASAVGLYELQRVVIKPRT